MEQTDSTSYNFDEVLSMGAKQLSPYRNRKLRIQICIADCMVKFLSPVFPHNFAKTYRQDLKMGYIDASRYRVSRYRAGDPKFSAPTGSGFRDNFPKNYPQDLRRSSLLLANFE